MKEPRVKGLSCVLVPVRVLLDDLVDFEHEGVVAKRLAHALLVKAKLGCRDGLALWDLRQVELKLLVVTPLRRELPVILHCGIGKHRNTGGGESTKLQHATNIHHHFFCCCFGLFFSVAALTVQTYDSTNKDQSIYLQTGISV